MSFDPARRKEVFEEFLLESMATDKKEAFDPLKPMGNWGIHLLDSIISGYLVHLKTEVDVYLPTVHEWLDFSIARNEQFGEGSDITFYHACMYRSKALAVWMSEQINAKTYWQQAFDLWKDFDSLGIYGKSVKTDFLDDFMQLCVQCEQYQAGIDRFEHYHGKKALSITKKMTAREYGYLLCRNHFEQLFSQEELAQAGKKMLGKYLEEPWLRMGLYSYAATWLKIVHWDHQNTDTPYETILEAYNDMPNTQPLE